MGRFLIEFPHAEEAAECAQIVRVFLSSGSHWLANTEWGCNDGVHTGWLLVDVDSKQEALAIVHPALRSDVRVIALNSFTLEFVNSEIERLTADPV